MRGTQSRTTRRVARGVAGATGAVDVGSGTPWANPYAGRMPPRAARAHYMVALLRGRLGFSVLDVRRDLAGKDLACDCDGEACHAEVLLGLADRAR